MSVLDELRERRNTARAVADEILTRAADESRDLTADESRDHAARVAEVRELDDEVEARLEAELAELRAAQTRRPTPDAPEQPVLTREQSVLDWCQTRGMVETTDQPLSFDRYLRGMCTGQWDGAPEERALSEGTLTAGGHLVPTPLSARVIDLARNATRVFQAGAVTVPMGAQTLKLARLTGEGTPAWKAENAAITDADLTFDSVTFTARTLVRLVKLSVELFEDSDPSAEDVIARSFAAQIALELDRVALRGTGTAPEPRGVLNQSGITTTTHGANGSAITNYDFWLDAKGVVMGNNFEPNAHIVAPRSVTSLSKLKEATTNAYLQPPANMLPNLATKQVPINLTVGTSTDCSEIYTAQWDQLMVGIRTDLRLEFLRERFLSDNLQYAFLAYLRADVQLAQPTAFVVDTGVRA
jgi:HK97 family phage major capsid protein